MQWSRQVRRKLQAMSGDMVLEKVLTALQSGETTLDKVVADPLACLLSGKTKKIVINTGGEGLKLSRAMLEELAKRGSDAARRILEEEDLHAFSNSSILIFGYFEAKDGTPLREDPLLIQLLEEDSIRNVGGMKLEVVSVPVETWAYKVVQSNDLWGSEQVIGY